MSVLSVTAGAAAAGLAELTVAVAIIFGSAAMAHCGTDCQPAKSAAELESEYTAELALCAATAHSLAESKLCRQGVNKKYGVCGEQGSLHPCTEGEAK